MNRWADFQAIKQAVKIEDVLGRYQLLDGMRRTRKGELVGVCPLPGHQETRGSFNANSEKGAWQCFGCKRQGNVLDLTAALEQISIREAALLLAEWFTIPSEQRTGAPETAATAPKGIQGQAPPSLTPLTFELKTLDPKHPYLLKDRGLTKEAIEFFGLGYCSRGLMKGRICIPVRSSEKGELVAYAGRWPGDPPEGEEKYKFPGGFKKSLVVFNLHAAQELAREKGEIILVEGFFDAVRFWEAGIHNVASIMGTSLSDRQAELLVETLGPQGKLVLCFDNDDAGRTGSLQVFETLSSQLFMRSLKLPREGAQADQLSDQEIHQFLSGW